MQHLNWRLDSFTDCDGSRWPHPTNKSWRATPETLARVGFYFDPIPVSGKSDNKTPSDRVACFICKAALSNWKPHHDPVDRHAELYCDCPMVKIMQSVDTLGGSGGAGSGSNSGVNVVRGSLVRAELRAARRQTFGKWWPYKQQQQYLAMPPKLSDAGMVYWPEDSAKDRVICFYCDNTFHRWQAGDDPMKIHVENAPECPFVVEWLESNNGGKQLLPISNRAVSTVMSETPKSRASRRQSTSPHRTADSSAAGVTPQPQPSKKRKLQRNDKVTNAADSVFKKTTAQEATEISNAGDYVMTSALAFLPGKTADLFNQQFALIERIINELNDNSTNTNNSNSARSSGNIPTISDDALRRQLEEARAETVEKNRRIGELERQLDSLVRQQKELSARQVQDLERQLLERQSEVDRLNATLQKTAEESAVWCNSWDMLKKENERLKSSLLLTIPSDTTALVSANGGDSANGNGSGVSSYGGGRYSGVLKLPPAVRRCWYEGEWRLFESRLADQQNFGGKEFLAVSDIPWPVSPATPVNCPLTFPMISSFLISDLKTDESLEFTRRLLDRFAKNRVQHEWGPCVLQRDRQRVSVRAEELTACLQKFINSCSI